MANVVRNDSQVALYADDTKVYKTIRSLADCIRLQMDLENMRKMEDEF